jgi:hypothetical protein
MINLLPPEQIKELKEEENFKIILNICLLILFFFISLFLILFSIKFYLFGNLQSQKIILEKTIINLEKEKEIKELNGILSKIENFNQKKILLFPQVEKIFEKIPPSIHLKDLEVKLDKKGEISFWISGFSETRESLLVLIKILKENYQEVSFSPEILLKETEIDFSLSFKIK